MTDFSEIVTSLDALRALAIRVADQVETAAHVGDASKSDRDLARQLAKVIEKATADCWTLVESKGG